MVAARRIMHCRWTRTNAGHWSRFLDRARSRRTEWSGPALFCQARHDPSASLFTAYVDVTVIRVPHETVAATLKLAIQFIQHEVREQGREWTALRCPLPGFFEQPAIKHTGPQVSPDEPQNPPVRDPRRHRGHQPVVIDPVKRRGDRLPIAGIFPIR